MSEKKIAEISALLDRKPPRTILGSIVLESYGEGAGSLAREPDVERVRALFALAAQAELEAFTTEPEAGQPMVVSA